ncbi:MAG: hypothetical protein ACP5RE_03460 [Candidatus Acidifodinimicrobium sp.]
MVSEAEAKRDWEIYKMLVKGEPIPFGLGFLYFLGRTNEDPDYLEIMKETADTLKNAKKGRGRRTRWNREVIEKC